MCKCENSCTCKTCTPVIKKTIDWTKPIRTMGDNRKVEILDGDFKESKFRRGVLCKIATKDEAFTIQLFEKATGICISRYHTGVQSFIVENVPEKIKGKVFLVQGLNGTKLLMAHSGDGMPFSTYKVLGVKEVEFEL